jgi:hypothetical protein
MDALLLLLLPGANAVNVAVEALTDLTAAAEHMGVEFDAALQRFADS